MQTRLTLFLLLCCTVVCAQKIRVACIGNSITYGYTIEDRDHDSYPAQLQKLLGDEYRVENFGVCGATAQNAGDLPWTTTPEYKKAKDFQPQIAVFKLGTNDSKPQNWVSAERFINDVEQLINEFVNLRSNPKVVLCLPAKAYKEAWSIRDEIIRKHELKALKALAKKNNWPLIDLYKMTSGKAELFPDGIHPNEKGAKIIAEAVAKVVQKQDVKPGQNVASQLGYDSDSFVTKTGKTLTISFIKHGTLMLDVDGYTVHIDPVTMFGTDYSRLPKADLLLVTHEHGDHYDPAAIAAVMKDGTLFISNGRVAELSKKSEAMQIGQKITISSNFSITATAAYNNSPGKEQFHPKGRDVGFLIELDDLKVYVAGDTEDIPEMKQLNDIDVAFLPVNQPYTMTPQQCINAVEMFCPKIVYPYHYGQTDLSPVVSHFKGNDKVEVRIRQLQ
ncbi:MAG: GDSL-type esterase/lipase family protein [Bacteroidaceae bacterium]|nr:GDSL-type esterase/lipase family protein [Bacteroidaceae bacterium]